VTLSNWSFAHPANTLALRLQLALLPVVTQEEASAQGSNITTFILTSGNTMTTTIELLGFCIVDTTTIAPINMQLSETGVSGLLDLVLQFPHFKENILYDPDFSVILNTGGGDGQDQLLLLSLLALLVIPGTMFVAAAIFVAWLVYDKKRTWARISRVLKVHMSRRKMNNG